MSNGNDDHDEDTQPPGPPPAGVPRVPSQQAPAAQQGGFRPIVTAPAKKPTTPGLPVVSAAPVVAPVGRPMPTISPTTAVAPPSQNPVAPRIAPPTINPAAPQRPNPAQSSGQTPRPAMPQIAPPVMAPIAPVVPTITANPAQPPRPASPVIAAPVMNPVTPQASSGQTPRPAAAPQRPVIAPPVANPAAAQPPRPQAPPSMQRPTPGVIAPPPPPPAQPARTVSGANVLVPPAPPAPAQPQRSAAPPMASTGAPAPARASPIPASGAVETINAQQAAELRRMATQLDSLDYFQLLGLAQTAGAGDIKKAFYRESRTYHPDRFFHMPESQVKEDIGHLYKRITEAYYVLKDDQKRKKYLADLASPERANRLRYTEATESELKAEARKVVEDEFGTNAKSRPFFKTAMAEYDKQNWVAAERSFKMGLMYEPGNARFKEKLAEVQKKIEDERRAKGPSYMIK
ncbi:MAG: DnaJ domain-containing protein [Archangium sp.]